MVNESVVVPFATFETHQRRRREATAAAARAAQGMIVVKPPAGGDDAQRPGSPRATACAVRDDSGCENDPPLEGRS